MDEPAAPRGEVGGGGPLDFTIPWPPFPFGSSRSKKARNNPERFRNYVRKFADCKNPITTFVAITLRFYLSPRQRLCDLDGLVEPFLNALQGRCFDSDIQISELHAYRQRVDETPRIEVHIEHRRLDQLPEELRKQGVPLKVFQEALRREREEPPSG